MQALNAGETAPDFSLTDCSGQSFTLSEKLKQGPVVLAFFKISCPTCQFAFPWFDRIFRGLGGQATLAGISQNSLADTRLFLSEFDLTMPMLLDHPATYEVSNAYGITHVPTLFLISTAGRIELSSVGWARADIEELAVMLRTSLHIPLGGVFDDGEAVAPFISGCASLN
jgi:peroxiredoxin